MHAEAPACVVTHHTPTQRASGSAPSNPRVPPAPGTYERNTETHETHVDPSLLAAGFHEGATFYELRAFAAACAASAGAASAGASTGGAAGAQAAVVRADVTLEDGLAAVAIGVAAELSIKEGRSVALAEVLGQ